MAGRPPFAPTSEQRQLVQNMAGINCTNEEILECVPWGRPDGKPIDMKTFTKHFGAELKRGKAVSAMRLKKKAAEMALEGDRTMLIFLLKTQHGYSEVVKVEATGKDGAPLPAAPLAPIYYLPLKDELPPMAPSPWGATARASLQLPAKDVPPALPAYLTAPPPPVHQAEPEPARPVAVGNVRPAGALYPRTADPRR